MEGRPLLPEAQKGLTHFVDLVKKYNKADQLKDEQDHANVMANEKAAVIYGQAWEAGSVTTGENGNPKLEGKIAYGRYARPRGQGPPVLHRRLGPRDDLQVQGPGPRRGVDLLFTNAKSMEVLASKNILPTTRSSLSR